MVVPFIVRVALARPKNPDYLYRKLSYAITGMSDLADLRSTLQEWEYVHGFVVVAYYSKTGE